MPESNHDGALAISGGRLHVEPAAGGRVPVLDWEDGVVVRVDGAEPPARPHAVRFGEEVELAVPADAPRLERRLSISDDGICATLSLERHPGATYRLADAPANRELLARRLVVERIACPLPSVGELEAYLHEHGVVHGLSRAALERLASGRSREEIVAEGTRPVEPVDGEASLCGAPPSGRAGGLWPAVAGRALAHVRGGRAGTPGRDVHGTVVAARAGSIRALAPGDNVHRSADGHELVASCDGFAELVEGIVSVRPTGTLSGDLDAAVGDLDVPGSLEISGSVREGMRLRVKGDLVVHGAIERAAVSVGGCAELHGAALATRLQVGGTHAVAAGLLGLIEAAPAELIRALQLVGQLCRAAASQGTVLERAQAGGVVLERHFGEVVRQLGRAAAYADDHRVELGDGPARALREAVALLAGVRAGSTPPEGLSEVSRLVARESLRLRQGVGSPVTLRCAALQGCVVEVAGDLVIVGRGSINSELHVAGDLRCITAGASLRGGEITVGGLLEVDELGSPGGAPVSVTLGLCGRLEARLVHAGVVVELGGRTVRYADEARDVALSAGPQALSA